MAMTLRLSAAGEQRLERLAALTGRSKNAVIEEALENWDSHAAHAARVAAAFDRVLTRDAEALERLGQ
jgi:predicted transcriptional regulator